MPVATNDAPERGARARAGRTRRQVGAWPPQNTKGAPAASLCCQTELWCDQRPGPCALRGAVRVATNMGVAQHVAGDWPYACQGLPRRRRGDHVRRQPQRDVRGSLAVHGIVRLSSGEQVLIMRVLRRTQPPMGVGVVKPTQSREWTLTATWECCPPCVAARTRYFTTCQDRYMQLTDAPLADFFQRFVKVCQHQRLRRLGPRARVVRNRGPHCVCRERGPYCTERVSLRALMPHRCGVWCAQTLSSHSSTLQPDGLVMPHPLIR